MVITGDLKPQLGFIEGSAELPRLVPMGAGAGLGGHSAAESTIWRMRWNQKAARVERCRGRESERQ